MDSDIGIGGGIDTAAKRGIEELGSAHDVHARRAMRYESLLRQAERCRREHTMLEQLCVGGVVAAFIWLARDAEGYTGSSALAWFLPIVIAFYGALKSQAIDARLAMIEDALRIVDAPTSPQPTLAPTPPPGRRHRWLLARAVWIVFVALTAMASMIGFEGGWWLGEPDDDQATTTASAASATSDTSSAAPAATQWRISHFAPAAP